MSDPLPTGITKRRGKLRVSVQQDGKRVTSTATTLREALDSRTVMQAELCIPRTDKTLLDAFKQTVKERWNESECKGFIRLQRDGMKALEFFGKSMPVDQLNRTDITSYAEFIENKGNCGATVNRALSPLIVMLRVAYEHGWVEKLPVYHHKKETKGRVRWLSDDEERRVLGLCREWGRLDHADLIAVLLDTGMRTGEVWALTKRDIDFTHNLIYIFENKTDHPRSLPMTKRVRDILFARTVTRNRPFPYDNNWLDRTWDRIRTVMGLEDDVQFVAYACRHTCATRLLQSNKVTLPELQLWLGHKNINTTMRYAHLCPSALRKGVEALEQRRVEYETRHMERAVAADGVPVESLPRVRGAEHSTRSPLERAVVPGVCADASAGLLQSDGATVGDGGSVEPTRTIECDDSTEPKLDADATVSADDRS